jgi:hypothetical protein
LVETTILLDFVWFWAPRTRNIITEYIHSSATVFSMIHSFIDSIMDANYLFLK